MNFFQLAGVPVEFDLHLPCSRQLLTELLRDLRKLVFDDRQDVSR